MEAEFTALLKASQKVSGLYLSYEVNITPLVGLFFIFLYIVTFFFSLLATIYYLNLSVFISAHRG